MLEMTGVRRRQVLPAARSSFAMAPVGPAPRPSSSRPRPGAPLPPSQHSPPSPLHPRPPPCCGTPRLHGSRQLPHSQHPMAVPLEGSHGPRAAQRHHLWHPAAGPEDVTVRPLGWQWGGRGWVGVKLAVERPAIASPHPLPAAQ